jgi:hypothetical protein
VILLIRVGVKMWVKSYSKVYQDVKKEDVWRLWADVNNWPKWDKELEYCKMDGSFAQGNHFILKPIKGPKVKIILSEVISNKKFTDYTKFPGAIMYDAHELEETPNGLHIVSTITVKGFLSFLWIKLVAKNVAASVPAQMDALVKLASSR